MGQICASAYCCMQAKNDFLHFFNGWGESKKKEYYFVTHEIMKLELQCLSSFIGTQPHQNHGCFVSKTAEVE